MIYFNFICSIICLSLASNICAVQNVINNTHVCPVTGIVWEEHEELPQQTNNNARVNMNVSPIRFMSKVRSHDHRMPMNAVNPALAPYEELHVATVGPIQTLNDVRLRVPRNEVINQINGIVDYLGVLTNDETIISCNRISFNPLNGEEKQIIIADKKWGKRCETKKATFGALLPLAQVENNDIQQVTYIQLSNDRCGILFELDGILDGNQQRTIRRIMIDY